MPWTRLHLTEDSALSSGANSSSSTTTHCAQTPSASQSSGENLPPLLESFFNVPGYLTVYIHVYTCIYMYVHVYTCMYMYILILY